MRVGWSRVTRGTHQYTCWGFICICKRPSEPLLCGAPVPALHPWRNEELGDPEEICSAWDVGVGIRFYLLNPAWPGHIPFFCCCVMQTKGKTPWHQRPTHPLAPTNIQRLQCNLRNSVRPRQYPVHGQYYHRIIFVSSFIGHAKSDTIYLQLVLSELNLNLFFSQI